MEYLDRHCVTYNGFKHVPFKGFLKIMDAGGSSLHERAHKLVFLFLDEDMMRLNQFQLAERWPCKKTKTCRPALGAHSF
jgi:hypothetical protein